MLNPLAYLITNELNTSSSCFRLHRLHLLILRTASTGEWKIKLQQRLFMRKILVCCNRHIQDSDESNQASCKKYGTNQIGAGNLSWLVTQIIPAPSHALHFMHMIYKLCPSCLSILDMTKLFNLWILNPIHLFFWVLGYNSVKRVLVQIANDDKHSFGKSVISHSHDALFCTISTLLSS